LSANGREEEHGPSDLVLAGRVVVVTGGASGIGLACAEACGQKGARIVLLSLPGRALDEATERLSSSGIDARGMPADVRSFASVTAAVDRVTGTVGAIDAVIASAGLADQSDLVSGDPDRWRDVLETNLLGAANTIRAVAPGMVASGAGDVVLIASLSGRDVYVGEPVYIASKWGMVGLGHAARRELETSGVRVCLVEPGLVDTPLTRSSTAVRRLLETGPSLTAEDVAAAVIWVLLRPRRVSVTELVIRPLGRGEIAFSASDAQS